MPLNDFPIPRTTEHCHDPLFSSNPQCREQNADQRPFQIDYRSFLDKLWEAMPADEFIQMISDKAVLGNPCLMTQHFIGGTRWEKVDDYNVIGYHQLRVPHQRYSDETRKHVVVKGHAHSHNTHWYKKIEGEWKFAGLNPDIRWFEYDFEKVFADGRDSFGTEEEQAAQEAEAKIVAGIPEKAPETTEAPKVEATVQETPVAAATA
jgi:scytalone dehydratase